MMLIIKNTEKQKLLKTPHYRDITIFQHRAKKKQHVAVLS